MSKPTSMDVETVVFWQSLPETRDALKVITCFSLCHRESFNVPNIASHINGLDIPSMAWEVCCLPALAVPLPPDASLHHPPKLLLSTPHRKLDSALPVSRICPVQSHGLARSGSECFQTHLIPSYKLAHVWCWRGHASPPLGTVQALMACSVCIDEIHPVSLHNTGEIRRGRWPEVCSRDFRRRCAHLTTDKGQP